MRRVVFAVVSTVAGLVMLLSFRTQPLPQASPPASLAPANPDGAVSPDPPGSSAPGTRTVTGDTVDTRYGPVQVQVQVTLAGGRITDVRATQLPQDNSRDIEIDNVAVPQLRQEALDTQSAHLHVVSGATFTSRGYAQSLQSALDQVS